MKHSKTGHGTKAARIALAVDPALAQNYILLPKELSVCEFAATLEEGYSKKPLVYLLSKSLTLRHAQAEALNILKVLTTKMAMKGIVVVTPVPNSSRSSELLSLLDARSIITVAEKSANVVADYNMRYEPTCVSRSSSECIEEKGNSIAAARFAARLAILLRAARKWHENPGDALEQVLRCIEQNANKQKVVDFSKALGCLGGKKRR